MKNWIKILTVAGFVLGGLALRPSFSLAAPAYTQSQSGGYFQYLGVGLGSMNFTTPVQEFNTVWGNATSHGWTRPYFTIDDTVATPPGAATLGNFVQITQVGLSVENLTNNSASNYLTVYCKDGSGTRQGNSDSLTVPPSSGGFFNANYTFSTPVNCDSNTLHYLYIGYAGGYGLSTSESDYRISGIDRQVTPGIFVSAEPITVEASSSAYSLSITINGHLGIGANVPTLADLATTNDQTTCSATDFNIFGIDYGQGLCNIFSFVFVPGATYINLFPQLWTSLQTKPPFGYLPAVTDTSTTSTSSLAIISNLTATSVPLTATNTLPSLGALTPLTSLFDKALAYLVGVSFIFFLLNRFRLFNF